MRVLDLRSPPQRWLESVWRRAGSRNTAAATGCEPGGPARSPWWNWADRLVDAIMAQRVARRHQPPERPLVVSVGNLALGGTGKTPVVVALAMDLAERGYRGAVLTRGYRSSLAGPVRVEADNVLAGDEARLMARSLAHQDWPVVQARRRRLGLDHIRDRWTDRDIVLVEDGHQTADLGRHLDVLLLDAWTISGSGPGAEVVPLTGRVFSPGTVSGVEPRRWTRGDLAGRGRHGAAGPRERGGPGDELSSRLGAGAHRR